MRTALLIIGLVTLASSAFAQTSTQRAQREAREYLTTCPTAAGDERDLCLFNQNEFVRNYVGAKSADYVDQKNVAFSLSHGNDGAIRINNIQACAWRLVVAHWGHSQANSSDNTMLDVDCGRLAENERRIAAARGATIETEIRRSPARKLAERPSKPCARPLDSTAYRLGEGPPIVAGCRP